MQPFLLSVEHLPSGLTRYTYDVGPDRRAVFTARSIDTPEVNRTIDGAHIASIMSTQRPPLRRPGAKG